MVSTGYKYLISIPGVCSGNTIIEGTRIGVHDVISLLVTGSSVDDVCRSFPDLTRAQVYECQAYHEDHKSEVDALVAQQFAAASEGTDELPEDRLMLQKLITQRDSLRAKMDEIENQLLSRIGIVR